MSRFLRWVFVSLGLLLAASSCGTTAERQAGMGGGGPALGGSAGTAGATSGAGLGGSAGGGSICAPGQALCDSVCVDTLSDNAHCGACGTACPAGSTCSAGTCACADGGTLCAGACTSVADNPANCGTCGTVCSAGQVCGAGACSCPSGGMLCGGSCVDVSISNTHCGGCDMVCGVAEACSAGSCTCQSGASGEPLTRCTTGCTNTTSDNANCGTCGMACPQGQLCSQGVCGTSCAATETECPSGCVNTAGMQTDPLNCGACGNACPAGRVCTNGACGCPSGTVLCGDECVDPLTSAAHCGSCNNACTGGRVCSGGGCGCTPGQLFCSSVCVNSQTDSAHCGACGNACTGGRSCTNGACGCPSGQTFCAGQCVNTASDPNHCGTCGMQCALGATCTNGGCMGGSGGAGGMGGAGGAGAGGAGMGGAGTGGAGMGGAGAGGAGAGGAGMGGGGSGGTGMCDPGTTSTNWATSCPTTRATCTAGNWTSWGSSSPENYPLRYETEHFAFLWPDGRNVSMAQVQQAGDFMENVLWQTYLGSPIFWPEPYCNTSNKLKTSVHIIESGLFGGCNNGRPGIWVGPGAMTDHWGLGHEWMHALQCMTPNFPDCGQGGCWIFESHANFMPHQLAEYRTSNNGTHCSEMLVNEPHLYYGSTRDRYCNWQFFEFLKDKHCYSAVNRMWTENAPNGQRDPWNKLALNMGWNAEQLNDLFGEWAMHNITWDYKNPPPTSGSNQGSYYRAQYGSITSTTVNNSTHRRHRLTRLEPLDSSYAQNRRFVSPFYWAPQRWGYNVVRLFPQSGATSVRVTFRGVTQNGANSGWRWGLVATDSAITTARYSPIQRGADGQLSFCVTPGENLFLVVVAAPTAIQKIIWDQAYPSIYRYPYMIELANAWPEGFQNGQPDACPSGTQRHSNGGGCAVSGLASSVYVGPYAQVLGGNVSGSARIEDQAVILSGATVSGGRVGALSTLNRFNVSGSATVQTTFYPPGFFETGQGLSGTARLFGDVEYRGANLNRNSGSFYGFVDSATQSATINDVTVAPPYAWRP